MDTIGRDVRELGQEERIALERLVGHELLETQRIIVQVVDTNAQEGEGTPLAHTGDVPAWWNVYEGLSDEEIDRLDAAVRQRADLTRALS